MPRLYKQIATECLTNLREHLPPYLQVMQLRRSPNGEMIVYDPTGVNAFLVNLSDLENLEQPSLLGPSLAKVMTSFKAVQFEESTKASAQAVFKTFINTAIKRLLVQTDSIHEGDVDVYFNGIVSQLGEDFFVKSIEAQIDILKAVLTDSPTRMLRSLNLQNLMPIQPLLSALFQGNSLQRHLPIWMGHSAGIKIFFTESQVSDNQAHFMSARSASCSVEHNSRFNALLTLLPKYFSNMPASLRVYYLLLDEAQPLWQEGAKPDNRIALKALLKASCCHSHQPTLRYARAYDVFRATLQELTRHSDVFSAVIDRKIQQGVLAGDEWRDFYEKVMTVLPPGFETMSISAKQAAILDNSEHLSPLFMIREHKKMAYYFLRASAGLNLGTDLDIPERQSAFAAYRRQFAAVFQQSFAPRQPLRLGVFHHRPQAVPLPRGLQRLLQALIDARRRYRPVALPRQAYVTPTDAPQMTVMMNHALPGLAESDEIEAFRDHAFSQSLIFAEVFVLSPGRDSQYMDADSFKQYVASQGLRLEQTDAGYEIRGGELKNPLTGQVIQHVEIATERYRQAFLQALNDKVLSLNNPETDAHYTEAEASALVSELVKAFHWSCEVEASAALQPARV